VPFAKTTREDLAACHAMAQAASEPRQPRPLSYTIAEVIEGWAGPPGGAREWLHHRAAERGED
jgi:hypothetical protein